MEAKISYSIDDWLVHHKHGVGQLKGRETKWIGGRESNYFRLEIENGTIFIPEEKMDSGIFRPIANQNTLFEVREILARPPKKMANGFLARTNQINDVLRENSILGIARIIRDLYGRRKKGKMLSATEESLLHKLNKRLVSEWAIVSGLDENEAQSKMKALLGVNKY